MLVEPSDIETKRFSKKLPYIVHQADTNAHIVTDRITEITGYICYKEYTSDKGLIERIPAETIVMEQPKKEDGCIAMSICTPDLGLENKGYFSWDYSKPIAKEIVLNGIYALPKEYEGVSIVTKNGKTYVTALCVHGQPVDFILKAL
jgi:chondroitin-sulfate-ABC endolyase/exolyase